MPKYLLQASYTAEGAKGLLEDSRSKCRQVVEQANKSAGRKLDTFYFAFDDTAAFVIVDAPDHATRSAASLAVNATGGAHRKTTVLLTSEAIDQAAKKNVKYRAPGQ
jgi:uncharacterized protein with GYD domain